MSIDLQFSVFSVALWFVRLMGALLSEAPSKSVDWQISNLKSEISAPISAASHVSGHWHAVEYGMNSMWGVRTVWLSSPLKNKPDAPAKERFATRMRRFLAPSLARQAYVPFFDGLLGSIQPPVQARSSATCRSP